MITCIKNIAAVFCRFDVKMIFSFAFQQKTTNLRTKELKFNYLKY